MVSVCICLAGKLPLCPLRHRLSSWQLFRACGGIPGPSSRHSLSPAYFMGTRGQGKSDGFPQKLLCVDSLWGGVFYTPTASFLLGSDCRAYRTEGVYEKQRGGRLMGDVKDGKIFKCFFLWMSDSVLHPSLGPGGHWRASRMCRWFEEECIFAEFEEACCFLSGEMGLRKCVVFKAWLWNNPGRPLWGGLFMT